MLDKFEPLYLQDPSVKNSVNFVITFVKERFEF